MLLAQATQPYVSEVPWVSWGSITLGVLGLLGYVLKVTIPKIVQDFREESEASRALFAEQLKAEREAGDKGRQEWRELLKEILPDRKV